MAQVLGCDDSEAQGDVLCSACLGAAWQQSVLGAAWQQSVLAWPLSSAVICVSWDADDIQVEGLNRTEAV